MIPFPFRIQGHSLALAALPLALAVMAPLGLAQTVDRLPAVYPAGSLRGEAAIQRLTQGGRIDAVAAENLFDADELRALLREDDSLWVDANDRLFYVDPAAPAEASDAGEGETYPGLQDIPLEDAFTLHSRPGSDKVVYLDFTGHHSVSNSWGHNIVFPPFNTNGSPETFSDIELSEIIQHWRHCVEDFAIFDIDVTTEEPPLSALVKNSGGDSQFGVRVVCTQPTNGFGSGIGGVALLNSFNDNQDNPVFTFNKGINTGSMTSSHEAGHAFGLSHDGLNGQSYHPGTSGWGPIMGAPFGSTVVHWSNGDYAGATSGQSDVGVISNSNNDVDVLDDDFGDDSANATPFGAVAGCPEPGPALVQGLIERRVDVDAFSFTTTGGPVTVETGNWPYGPNVDLMLTLLDSGDNVIATDDPQNSTNASISETLAAGDYTVLVEGTDRDGVYSDYGSRGYYTVGLTLPGQELVTELSGGVETGAGVVPSFFIGAQSGNPCPGESLELQVFSAPFNALTYLVLGLADLNLPFKGGVLVPDPDLGVIVPMSSGFFGFFSMSLPWPLEAPPNVTLFTQFWFVDATAAEGFAATNAYRFYSP